MYDTTIAAKLLKQLESYLGRISPHFHKPVARFIGDMVYGIMAGKDVKLAYLNKRLNEVPQFGAYAITAGLRRAFSAFGRLARSIARIVPRTEKVDISQHLPGFAELLGLDDG